MPPDSVSRDGEQGVWEISTRTGHKSRQAATCVKSGVWPEAMAAVRTQSVLIQLAQRQVPDAGAGGTRGWGSQSKMLLWHLLGCFQRPLPEPPWGPEGHFHLHFQTSFPSGPAARERARLSHRSGSFRSAFAGAVGIHLGRRQRDVPCHGFAKRCFHFLAHVCH